MTSKQTNRLVGGIVFLISFIQFAMTVQPSVPFWDCGEFTAAASSQQVPHPPGAPLFLMVGRLFHMIPIGDPGWRVNMVSVLASALSVLLLYLTAVEVVRVWRKKEDSITDKIIMYGTAAIGALSLSFSDSFWFNGVESEVYAGGSLFMGLVLWLIMRWYHEADKKGNERYLLLIAYIIGLSTGVHLLSILTTFTVVMIIYFRKYEVTVQSFLGMMGAALVSFLAIYPGIVIWLPTMLAGDFPLKTTDADGRKVHMIEDSPAVTIAVILLVIGVVYFLWWSRKEKKNPLWSMASLSVLCMLVGYFTYAQVLVRSNARPPLNENAPSDLPKLISYLSREQYGDNPMISPRRWSQDPMHRATWANYKSDGEFFWKWQIDHMFFRYMWWNYIGKAGDRQDAPSGTKLAVIPEKKADLEKWWYGSSYGDTFPIRFWGIPFLIGMFGMYWHFKRDWKMGLAFLAGFLVMGVVAAFVQNQQEPQPRERDYFYCGAFAIFSMWVGIGVLGILELIEERMKDKVGGWLAPAGAVFVLGFIAVDVNMAVGGWKSHDRSGNYLPWDYSYNILQSCDKDAILFTYGDNDTFPLWYLQDVAGVRRDVRIVNLSLGQTHWYIKQLKHERPWGTAEVPLTIPDELLDKDEEDPSGLYPQPGNAKVVEIPVPADTMRAHTKDSALIARPVLRFTYTPGATYGKQKYFRVNDQLVYDIVKTNAERGWTRPICWSVTVAPDAYVGLGSFLKMQGMVVKLQPVQVRTNGAGESVDEQLMMAHLLHTPDHPYTEPHLGFMFRNLDDPKLYIDAVHRGYLVNFREAFLTTARALLYADVPRRAEADSVLNMMDRRIPHARFPLQYFLLAEVAGLYQMTNDTAQLNKFTQYTIDACNDLLTKKGYNEFIESRYPTPYEIMLNMYEARSDYDKGLELLNSLLPQVQGNANQQKLIKQKIYEMQVKQMAFQGKYKEALGVIDQALQLIGSANDQNSAVSRQNFQQMRMQLQQKAGIAPAADTGTPHM